MPDHEAGGGRGGQVPARTRSLGIPDGVPAQPGDLGEGVAAVGVDGDPFPWPRRAPALQLAGGEGTGDEAAAEEGEADRARAVVAVGVEGGVAAAPYIGAADDHVGVVDRSLHRFGRVRRRERDAREEDRGVGSPLRLWAKICSRLRCEAWGTAVPLLPAEAGGSFDGSAAISAAVGTSGVASGSGFAFAGAAST